MLLCQLINSVDILFLHGCGDHGNLVRNMPFVSPIHVSEQSPSRLLKPLRYNGPCDIKLPAVPKPIEDGFNLNLGTRVISKTDHTETALVPDPYTTKCENQ